ncbi:DctP family TRAP transporter solute-binding subunit [uncultured Propionivibrio sp.]|uniref:DctP family TRAP transporter solute-binding subunit n=1 Tax=uncultured Propionivibrio sp. TaxID=426737 RepID=UPI0029BFDBAF|nr:DctP family TRAP transporter solute-binding subunit [uncultured Propionivibrio sp.]
MKSIRAGLVGIMLLGLSGTLAWGQAQPVKLRFGHAHPTSDSQHIAAVEFARKVKERTQGMVDIQVFPNNQLGNDATMIAGVRGGTIDIETSGNPFFTGIVAKLNVLDLPYLLENNAHVAKVLDGPIGRSLLNELEPFQMKGLAFWEVGYRSLANSRRPVNNADDIKGLKLRTTPNQAHIKAFQLLGAAPQPMPFAEVYAALESKALDGHENPPNVMLSTKMYEVQKYLSLTKHAYTGLIVVMNKKRFDSLAPEHQQVIVQEAANAAVLQRDLNAKGEAAALAELRAHGMQINEKPDVNSIKTVVRDETRKMFIEKNGDELIKAIDAAR